MIDTQRLRDRCRGTLVGAALGDAVGAPFEGDQAPRNEAVVELLWGVKELRYTDDTAMTIAVAESIVDRAGLDQESLVESLAGRFEADPARGYGSTPQVLRAVRAGRPWRAARLEPPGGGLRGDGGAMRATPVAVLAVLDPDNAARLGEQQAEVTHAHPVAIDAAQLQVRAIVAALTSPDRGQWNARAVLPAALASHAHSAELAEQLRAARPRPGAGISSDAAHAVPAAIHVAARHGDDVVDTIRAAIALGGDTDTVASMAAAITGAHVGFDDIPTGLVVRLEDHEKLIRLADELLAVALGPK